MIFIDEIESALHPKAVCQFLDMIDNIANEMGLQVFITSHSYFVIIIFQIEDSAQYKEKLRQILPKKRKLSIRSTYKRLLKRCAILLIYMQTLC
ncbi:AAA family ATPase [Jutongia huaianensis]|uniref:ATP-binding protein n=1 Tax=Jutongia huaianensis TaxID=2763668 RepID=A0ABR7N4A2_9FIRM|nr:ATP-binding protein [Jutongia huaianensis]